MKIVSPFEPLSFWAQGPWVFFNLGLKFMQSWQEECFSRLRLNAAPGKPAARPELKLKSPSELDALGAAIAARQGRETPLLGCLQGAQVVGGPQAVSPQVVLVEPVAKAAVKPAAPAKPKADPVAAKAAPVAPKVEPATAKVAPVAAQAEAPQSASLFADDPAPATVESSAAQVPSVTSMLAMQAKSLAKAVKTAPPATHHGKTNGKTNGKSAAKPTAKPTAKVTAQVKTAAKAAAPKAKPAAGPAVKAKPVASKKA